MFTDKAEACNHTLAIYTQVMSEREPRIPFDEPEETNIPDSSDTELLINNEELSEPVRQIVDALESDNALQEVRGLTMVNGKTRVSAVLENDSGRVARIGDSLMGAKTSENIKSNRKNHSSGWFTYNHLDKSQVNFSEKSFADAFYPISEDTALSPEAQENIEQALKVIRGKNR